MSFQALKKKKSRGRIILLSQCSQTPESHYDNLVLLNLHLQFHLKNPLCFLPCKVEVRTESGQGPSARKREAEKVNILPRKEARLPCWVVRKQRQQNSSSFRKTDLRDSCRSVPGQCWCGWYMSGSVLDAEEQPECLQQTQAQFIWTNCSIFSKSMASQVGCLKSATVGGSTPWKSTNATGCVVFLLFRELLVSYLQHTTDYLLQEEKQIMDKCVTGWEVVML